MAFNMINALKIFGTALAKAGDGKLTFTDAEKQLLNANGSITRLVSRFILKPTLIVTDAVSTDVREKVMEMNVDIFTAFYIQAFKVMVDVNQMESTIAFDLLSSDSNNQAINLLSIDAETSLEDFDFLPIKNKIREVLTMEEGKSNTGDYATTITKEFEITFNIKDSETRKIIVPVTVKTNVIHTNLSSIINVLDSENENSFSERWDAWRSGGISGLEFLTASDLIENYKKSKLNDKDELMNYMSERTNAAYSKVGKGGIGFSAYYAMIVISRQEVSKLNRVMRTKITKEKGKEAFLTKMKALTYSIVDDLEEDVVVYTRDITGSSYATFKALKKQKSGGTMDEILKALVMNKPPVI